MNKSAWKIAKVIMRNLKVAYIVTGVVALEQIVQTLIYMIIASNTGVPAENTGVSAGCLLWMLPLWAAVEIPVRHFGRIINLGGKRDNFISGCLMVYTVLAAATAMANTVIFYTFDRFIQTSRLFTDAIYGGVFNLIEIFGWNKNGAIIAFLQQFAFLFLVTAVIHTLTAMYDKWYGWATGAVIATILGTFIPIAPLRSILLGFFGLTIFHPVAFLHIPICLVLGLAVYSLNKPIFSRKLI